MTDRKRMLAQIAYNNILGLEYQLTRNPNPDPRVAIAQIKSVQKCLREIAPEVLGDLPE